MFSKYYRFGFILYLLFFFFSCDRQVVTDQVISLPVEGWEYSDKIVFEYVISDTLVPYNIQLHIRNTKNYSYSNLWLFIETFAPTGNSQRDTLEIILADETGRWTGKSTQSINTLLVPFKENVRFPERGIYRTVFQHAMRDTIIKNITDIGLLIQYQQPK